MRAAVEAAEREDAARKDAAKIAAENGPGARLGDPFVALTSSDPPRCSVVAASVEELRASLKARARDASSRSNEEGVPAGPGADAAEE